MNAAMKTPFLLLGILLGAPALAHHPMGGDVPATWWAGLLSGLGHPVIEIDHLVFLLAGAVAVALSRLSLARARLLLPIYVFAGATGTALRITIAEIPFADAAVLLSLAAVALSLWAGRLPGAMVIAAFGGLAHGYAYGEAIVGAESTPILAYLLGLAMVQSAMLILAWLMARRLPGALPTHLRTLGRTLGVLVAGVAVWAGAGLLA